MQVGAQEGQNLLVLPVMAQFSRGSAGIGLLRAPSSRGTGEFPCVHFYVGILQPFITIFNSIKRWHTVKIGESSAFSFGQVVLTGTHTCRQFNNSIWHCLFELLKIINAFAPHRMKLSFQIHFQNDVHDR